MQLTFARFGILLFNGRYVKRNDRLHSQNSFHAHFFFCAQYFIFMLSSTSVISIFRYIFSFFIHVLYLLCFCFFLNRFFFHLSSFRSYGRCHVVIVTVFFLFASKWFACAFSYFLLLLLLLSLGPVNNIYEGIFYILCYTLCLYGVRVCYEGYRIGIAHV